MGRVCLILPVAPAPDRTREFVEASRAAFEESGHFVEVLVAFDPDAERPLGPTDGAWRWVEADARGLSSAAMAGFVEAGDDADFLVVLDPRQGYLAADLPRMIEPLAGGEAELTIAQRFPVTSSHPAAPARVGLGRRLAARSVAAVARPLLGASNVFAGLVALTPELARAVRGSFEPVGSRFTIDLLVRARGRRAEVPVRAEGAPAPVGLGLDDLRHLKRLADDRFGNASRLIQFCAVGASGMVVDLSCYALFQVPLSRTALAGRTAPLIGGSLDLAVAGALAIGIALTWNFSLNRRLTFSYARGGSIVRQFLTYALSNALGIALSFSLRLTLPAHVAFFGRHKLAAAVVGIVTATGISFSMARWVVFSRRSVARDRLRSEARTAASS